MLYTTNYGLKKPEGNDNFDIANDNFNMDKLDSTIKSISDAVTAAQNTANAAIPTTQKGTANGVATLDASGTVPDAQIPASITRDTELSSHTNRTDNPHAVTAAQTGAVAKTGDTMTGQLMLNNGGSDTPEIAWKDAVNNTAAYMDIQAEGLRVFSQYRGGTTIYPFRLGLQSGSMLSKNNTLDDGNTGAAMFAGAVTLAQQGGTAANNWSQAFFFNSKKSDGTAIQANIQSDPNGVLKLNQSGGNPAVMTKNNTLDDGSGNATFVGGVTLAGTLKSTASYLDLVPSAGGHIGFSNNAMSAYLLGVDDATGKAYTKNNTLDNGSGAATFAGPVTLPSDPTLALQAATKQYADNKFAQLTITLANNTDLNTVVTSGFYRLGSGNTNGPATSVDYGQLIVSRGGDTVYQIATGYTNSEFYMRHGNPPQAGGSGSWQSWRRVWHDGNLPNPSQKHRIGQTIYQGSSITYNATSNQAYSYNIAAIKAFKYVASEWSVNSFAMEADVQITGGGSGYFGLFDETTSAVVAGSESAFTSSTAALRGPSVALTDGHVYTFYLRVSNSTTTMYFYSADIVQVS